MQMIAGYVIATQSIEFIFNEFEKWGRVSGARINKSLKGIKVIAISRDKSQNS